MKAIIKDFISQNQTASRLAIYFNCRLRDSLAGKQKKTVHVGLKNGCKHKMLTEVRQGTETSEADRVNSAVS